MHRCVGFLAAGPVRQRNLVYQRAPLRTSHCNAQPNLLMQCTRAPIRSVDPFDRAGCCGASLYRREGVLRLGGESHSAHLSRAQQPITRCNMQRMPEIRVRSDVEGACPPRPCSPVAQRTEHLMRAPINRNCLPSKTRCPTTTQPQGGTRSCREQRTTLPKRRSLRRGRLRAAADSKRDENKNK
jgi:hypothetical protein